MLKSQKISLVVGIGLIIYFLIVNPIQVSMNPQSMFYGSALMIFTNIIIRFFVAWFCMIIAEDLHRSQLLWYIIGLALPAFSLIIIAFVKLKKQKATNTETGVDEITKQ